MSPLYSLPSPAGYRAQPTTNLLLDSRSPNLLATPQPFPTTAAALITALGSPAGLAVANARGAYLCANAGNQLDSLAIGPALVQAGGALDSRVGAGLPDTSFASKLAVELLGGAELYGDAGNAYGNANASAATVLIVFRVNTNANAAERWIVTKWNGAVGWTLSCSSTYLRATGAGSASTQRASLAVDPRDGAWHWAIVVVDDSAKTIALHSDLGSVTSAAYTGSVTNAGSFSLGYTANSFSGQLAGCYVLASVSPIIGSYATGRNPKAVNVDPLGQVWIVNYGDDTATVYNAATRVLIGTYAISPTPSGAATNAIASDSLNQVWIVRPHDDVVAVYNAASKGLVGTYPTGDYPYGVAIDGSGQSWIINRNASTVTVYNRSSKLLIGTYATGLAPEAIAAVLGRVWIVNANAATVTVYSAGTKVLLGTYATGAAPCAIAGDTLGQVWIVNKGAATVSVFDGTTMGLIGTYATGLSPQGVVADTLGRVWIANYLAATVTVYNAATKAVIGTYATGLNPSGVDVDALGQVWVANQGSWTVSVFDTALVCGNLTAVDGAVFWRSILGNSDVWGTDNTYTRANPLVTRLTNVLGQVACYGANQPATAYAPNASTADNALKTSIVCEDAISFLGLGSNNMPAFVGTNAAVTATDGPSGMRDACRVADTDGVNAGFATSGAAVPVGATNVPFVYAAYVKSGGVGANAVFQSYYTGDAGGPETFTNWTIAGAVGAAWRPFAGLTHTPVGAAHTAVVCRMIPTDNVGASLGTVDFAEVWGVQNSALDRLAWRRVATGAAAATGAQTVSYANAANAVYNPAQGRVVLRIANFAGTNGAVFLGFGAAAAAGSLVLDYSGGALRLRIWDDAAALVGTATCGAVSTAEHTYVIEWNAAAGTASVMEGATVLGSAVVAPWTPEPLAVTPLYVGTDAAGVNAARCYCVLLTGYSY